MATIKSLVIQLELLQLENIMLKKQKFMLKKELELERDCREAERNYHYKTLQMYKEECEDYRDIEEDEPAEFPSVENLNSGN